MTGAATRTSISAPRSRNRGSDLKIDLTDSHAQVASFINSSYPNMYSSVVVALSYLIDPDTPKNDGTFRPLEIIAKPGTVVWANPGAPVTLATNHCAPGDHRGDHQGAGAGLPGARDGRLGPPLPHRDPGQATRAARHPTAIRPDARSSGISSRRGPAAARRRPATAGPAPANGRRPAASSSAASKSPRCASRCSSRRTSSARIPAAPGRYRGGPGGVVEMVVETAEPAIGNTAGDGVSYGACGILGGEDGLPHRYLLHSGNDEPRADPDQGNRPRDPPRRPSRPRIRRRRRLGRPREARSGRDRGGCRERVCDAMTAARFESPPPLAGEGQGGGIEPRQHARRISDAGARPTASAGI